MRLAAIGWLPGELEERRRVLSAHSAVFDVLCMLGVSRSAAEDREIVRSFPRLVLFRRPSYLPEEPRRLAVLDENVRRCFRPDRIVWLEPGRTSTPTCRSRLETSDPAPLSRDPASSAPHVVAAGGASGECAVEEAAAARQVPESAPAPRFGAIRSGIFDPAFHRQRRYEDRPPFRYLAERLEPETVLDVGCGSGGYLRLLRSAGATTAVGVEGFEPSPDWPHELEFVQHDLRRRLELGRRFDLVLCLEVAEHLAPRFGRRLLRSLDRHAGRWILFSAARPGQRGHGHVNCRPLERWIDDFARLGWYPDVFTTLALRSLSTLHWFRRNLVLLQREETQSSPFGIEDLKCLEAEMPWIGQAPQVVDHPLGEDLPGWSFTEAQ